MKKLTLTTPMGKQDAFINPSAVSCIFKGTVQADALFPKVFLVIGSVMLQTDYESAQEVYDLLFGDTDGTSILKGD